ncbi:MAG: hypoxanthine phosphoribosyltransferase [Chlorobi bacterium]|nr:hypoxanthine phosphoribosyltransferase [Chlorobiota bacterium]
MTPDALSAQPSAVPEASELVLHDRRFRLFIERRTIAAAVERLASAIARDYSASSSVVAVVVLKGALLFAADLIRLLPFPVRVEFVRASSYGAGMTSSGSVHVDGRLEGLEGHDILLIEDIADSGTTLGAIVAHLERSHPRSIAVATLLSKPSVHNNRIPLTYVGIEIEPVFVVGYGLDYNELGRNLPDIYCVVDDGKTS